MQRCEPAAGGGGDAKVFAGPAAAEGSTRLAADRVHWLAWCVGIFAWLAAWAVLWPYTGEGDAAMHYLNLRESVQAPGAALHAWARPGWVALMVVPAMGGLLTARIAAAALAAVLAWQTMAMARERGLAQPWLAGALLITQPLFFALASDTMTEMPMALGFVLAARLWWHRRHATSAVLVSWLPLVRPEGFFLGVMWGAMLLFDRRVGSVRRRVMLIPLLLIGTAAWLAVCWWWTGDPLYVLSSWSWPARSHPSYGSGSLFHHVVRWPYYCGPVLLVLFIAGLRPSWRRGMALPWAIWLLVFVLHSILWWRGWFASVGLMRIMASTAPFTALICLHGWHAIGRWLDRRHVEATVKRRLALATIIAAVGTAMLMYAMDAQHYRGFGQIEAAGYLRQSRLLGDAPRVFYGDHIALAELGLPPRSPRLVRNTWSAEQQAELYRSLPVGTVGVWDNAIARRWHHLGHDDLKALGYKPLHEVRYRPVIGLRVSGDGLERPTFRMVAYRKVR